MQKLCYNNGIVYILYIEHRFPVPKVAGSTPVRGTTHDTQASVYRLQRFFDASNSNQFDGRSGPHLLPRESAQQ